MYHLQCEGRTNIYLFHVLQSSHERNAVCTTICVLQGLLCPGTRPQAFAALRACCPAEGPSTDTGGSLICYDPLMSKMKAKPNSRETVKLTRS